MSSSIHSLKTPYEHLLIPRRSGRYITVIKDPSPPPSIGKDEAQIFQDAQNIHTPIGQVCIQTIFRLIPKEWILEPVDRWLWSIPRAWKASIKEDLLSNRSASVDKDILDDATLSKLVEIGLQKILYILSLCKPEMHSSLAEKNPFSVPLIIRMNVEFNPYLDTDKFVDVLQPLIFLMNKILMPREELIAHIGFLKSVYCSSDGEHPSHEADALLLFLLQFFDVDANSNAGIEPLFQIFSACMHPNASLELSRVFDGDGQVCLPVDIDTNTLSWLLKFVYDLCEHVGEGAFASFFQMLRQKIQTSLAEGRDSKIVNLHHSLWLSSGDLVYTFDSCFKDSSFYTQACEILDKLPRLTPHLAAVEILRKKLFGTECDYCRKKLVVLIYKSWWYQKPSDALVDRLIDWVMHSILTSRGGLRLDYEEAEQLAIEQFYEFAPVLPFKTQRAQSIYHSLRLAYREANKESP